MAESSYNTSKQEFGLLRNCLTDSAAANILPERVTTWFLWYAFAYLNSGKTACIKYLGGSSKQQPTFNMSDADASLE